MPLPTEVVEQRNLLQRAAGRLWSGLVAVWAAVTGLAPHVLHHVGPLAGAAIVSGIAGTALFGAIGFVATVPLLLRLHRRFGSWRAPAIALALFVTVFTASTILGSQLTGADVPAGTSTTDGDHEEHHP
jgi:hypothetical protein